MPRGALRVDLPPPQKGVRSDLPKHLVPDGFLAAGENVICRDGRVYTRPGYLPLTTTAPTANRVMGGIHYFDNTATQRVVVGTTASFHSFNGSTWSAITGATVPAGGDADQFQFAVYPRTSSTRLIAVNDQMVPQVWTGSGNFADLGGSPPIARSATVAFERAVLGNLTISGTRQSSDIAVSAFQDPASWPTTLGHRVSLTDTKDSIVAVKALNAQVFAIYKDRSQWVGIGTANLFPFTFELRDQQVGPVSPNVVVQAENDHYYVGQDGDVYQFDGNRARAIGGWAKRLIQNDLDFNNMGQSHGFYDRINREIWWFWPSYRAAARTGGIAYRLPYEDVPGAFSPLMVYTDTLTASLDWRDTQTFGWNDLTGTWDNLSKDYPTWDSFPNLGSLGELVGQSSGQVHRFGRSGGDNGTTFDAYWDLPYRALAGVGDMAQIDVIESFFKQTSSTVNAQIVLMTTDTLATDGTLATAQEVDLSSNTQHRASYANTLARFATVRHRILAGQGLNEFRGSVLFFWRRGEQ